MGVNSRATHLSTSRSPYPICLDTYRPPYRLPTNLSNRSHIAAHQQSVHFWMSGSPLERIHRSKGKEIIGWSCTKICLSKMLLNILCSSVSEILKGTSCKTLVYYCYRIMNDLSPTLCRFNRQGPKVPDIRYLVSVIHNACQVLSRYVKYFRKREHFLRKSLLKCFYWAPKFSIQIMP